MTKDELKTIQAEIAAFLETKGYALSKSTGRFGEGYGTLSLTILSKSGGKTPEAIAFERYAELEGMRADWLGKAFSHRGRRFKITGYNGKARRFPVLAADLQGRMYKFPVETVRLCMRIEGYETPKSAIENVEGIERFLDDIES